jgi:hypothetical protein
VEYPFSVRKITVGISSVPGQPPQRITFTANSPEKAWLNTKPEYLWDFGDGTTESFFDTTTVVHQYDRGGKYEVIVKIKCILYEDDTGRYEVAADTLSATVLPIIDQELKIEIAPQDTIGSTAAGVTLKVLPNISDLIKKYRWMVDYGDGKKEEFEQYIDDRSVSHLYSKTGDYVLSVAIRDPESGSLLAQDSAVVHINNLPFLQKTNKLFFTVNAYCKSHYEILDENDKITYNSVSGTYSSWGSSTTNLEWDGNSFFSIEKIIEETNTKIIRIEGTVSGDGTKVERLKYTYDFSYPNYEGKVWTRGELIVIENLPLTTSYIYRHSFYRQDVSIGQYVTAFEYWSKIYNPVDRTNRYDYRDFFDWQNTTQGIPKLELEFTKQ